MALERTPRTGDRADRLEKRPLKAGVSHPLLFVLLEGSRWYGHKYAKARIRIRKGCYQYLIWNEDGKKREFYLGKKDFVPPEAPGASSKARSRKGGKK